MTQCQSFNSNYVEILDSDDAQAVERKLKINLKVTVYNLTLYADCFKKHEGLINAVKRRFD